MHDLATSPRDEVAGFVQALASQLPALCDALGVNAGGPNTEDETVASLKAQLEDLYAEKERLGHAAATAAVPASVHDAFQVVHEWLDSGRRFVDDADNAPMLETITSLTAQLEDLYAEKERGEPAALIASLTSQLEDIYAEREDCDHEAVIASLTEQVESMYAEKEHGDERDDTIDSLTSQLEDLYAEKANNQDRAVIASLTAQLEDLYAEKEANDHDAVITSLTEQVEALYAEKEHGSEHSDTIASLIEQVEDLYALQEAHSSTLTSLTSQLEELYAEKEQLVSLVGADVVQGVKLLAEVNADLMIRLESLFPYRRRAAT